MPGRPNAQFTSASGANLGYTSSPQVRPENRPSNERSQIRLREALGPKPPPTNPPKTPQNQSLKLAPKAQNFLQSPKLAPKAQILLPKPTLVAEPKIAPSLPPPPPAPPLPPLSKIKNEFQKTKLSVKTFGQNVSFKTFRSKRYWDPNPIQFL